MSQQRGAPLSDLGSVLYFRRNSATESVPPGREEGLQSDGVCQKQEGTLTNNSDDGQGDRRTAGVRVLSDLLQDDQLQEDATDSWGMRNTGNTTTRTSSASTVSSNAASLDRGQRTPSEQMPALEESGMSFDLLNNPALADMLEWGSSRSLIPAGAAATDLVFESTGEDAADCALGGVDERLSTSEMSELEGGGGGGVEVVRGGGLDKRWSSSVLSRLGGSMGQLLKERPTPWEIGTTEPPDPRPNHPTSPFEPLKFSSASEQRGLLGAATAPSRCASSVKAGWRTSMTKSKSMNDIREKGYKVGRLGEVEEEHVGEGGGDSRAAPQAAAGAAAIEPGDISAMFDFVPSSVEVAGSGGVTRMGTTLPAVDSQAKKKMLESMLSSIESEMTHSSKSLFGLAQGKEELGIKRYGGPARRRNTTATATATANKAEAATAAASDGGIQPQCRRSERSSSSACQDDAPVFQEYLMCEDVFSMVMILLFIGCGCVWLIL